METFSLEVLRLGGSSVTVTDLQASDQFESLINKVQEKTDIPKSGLRFIMGDKVLDLRHKHESLASLQIASGSCLQVVQSNNFGIYARDIHQHGGKGGCWNEFDYTSTERVLFESNSSCMLLNLDVEDSASSLADCQYVHWHVLLGTYEIVDQVAVCDWQVHCHRKVGRGGGFRSEVDVDEAWQKMDAHASLKWRRIELPECPVDRMNRHILLEYEKKTDLLGEVVFVEKLNEDDLRHFHEGWFDTANGVPADLLQQVCNEEDEVIQACKDDGFKQIKITTDHLPIALAKVVCRWNKLDEADVLNILQSNHDELRGIDVIGDRILGVPMSVTLADDEYAPVDKEVYSKLPALLSLLTGSSIGNDGEQTEGIGGVICGMDGQIWGTVVANQGSVWMLDSGRTAKKQTEGSKWHWKSPGDQTEGIGGVIFGMDGRNWGIVVADEGSVWRLDSGRTAKKQTEGSKWYWKSSGSGFDGWTWTSADSTRRSVGWSCWSDDWSWRSDGWTWDSWNEGGNGGDKVGEPKEVRKGVRGKLQRQHSWTPFTKIADLAPDSVDVKVKAILVSKGSSPKIADETGMMSLQLGGDRLKLLKIIQEAQDGTGLIVRHANVAMVRAHMHLRVDAGCSLEISPDDFQIQPNTTNDKSAVEYELR